MSLTYRTFDYFKKFSCLGDSCPDTCCQRWEVKLDKQHYEMLELQLQSHQDLARLFHSNIQLNDSPIAADYDYARILMNEKGYCSMLDENQWCRLHKALGEEPLGNVCAFYPRVINRCYESDKKEVMELSGAISCPEVARKCLTSRSLPSLVSYSPSIFPRSRDYPITRELPRRKEDKYAQYFHTVRQGFLSVIENEDFSFNARLYTLAVLAHRLSSFYHAGSERCDAQQVKSLIKEAVSEKNFQQNEIYLENFTSSTPITYIVLQSIFKIKQQQFPDEKISRLLNIIEQDMFQSAGLRQQEMELMPADVLQRICNSQAEKVTRDYGEWIDACLTRYMQNCLYREWFYTMPDTFTYIQMLLLRIAMLKFLIFQHPQLQRAINQEPSLEREALEEVIIEVVYLFAREVDQNLPFLQVVFNAISEQDMMNFDYSLAFIKP